MIGSSSQTEELTAGKWGLCAHKTCVWDYHIKNIYSYWHHTKPKADKTSHMKIKLSLSKEKLNQKKCLI